MARSAAGGGDMEDILLGGAMGAGGAAIGKLAGPSVNRMLGGAASTTTGLENLSADFDKTSDFFTTASSDGFGAALQPSAAAFNETFGTTPLSGSTPATPATPASSPSKNLAPIRVSGGDVDFGRVKVDTMSDIGRDGFEVVGGTVDGQRFGVGAPTPVPTTNLAPSALGSDFEGANFKGTYTDPDTGFFGRNFPETTKSVTDAFDDPVGFLSGAETQTPGQQAVATGELAGKIAPEIRAKNPTLSPAAVQKLALDAAKQQVADAQPGFLGKNRGLLLAGGIAGAAALPSLMEVPEMEEPDLIEKISPEERAAMVAANRLPPGALTPRVTSPRQTRVATAIGSQGFNQRLRDRFPELFGAQLAAADGGEVFPRRTGGIMPNEGTPGKDSVKALVMPGEFIFTTNAVKGAGNGDLQQGINNMYGVMRNLEARGARMA
jgi:hypothetical protein